MSLYTPFFSSERDSHLLTTKLNAPQARWAEPKLSVLQTVKNHYVLEAHYRTHCLANRSPRYDDTASSYVAKLVEMFELQMKADFFEPENPVSIIGFFATFELACDTNKIHKDAAMWVLPRFLKEIIDNELKSRTGAED